MNQDSFDPEIYSDFVLEAREHLESIEPKLLELENNPDDLSLLDDIFRPMHSLKGASGFLGLKQMNILAHKGESILDELRKGLMKVSPAIMDLVLEATDALREMVDNLEAHGEEGKVGTDHVISQIDELLEKRSPETARERSSATPPRPEKTGDSLKKSDQSREETYSLTLVSQDHLSDFMEEVREILSDVGSMLLDLEKNPDPEKEAVNNLFRSFHNIKGNSAIIGFQEINVLSHEAETILNKIRSGELRVNRALVDVLLSVSDVMESILNMVDQNRWEVKSTDISVILEQLRLFSEPEGRDDHFSQEFTAALEPEKQRHETKESDARLPAEDTAEPSLDQEDLSIFEQAVRQQFEKMNFALKTARDKDVDNDFADGLYRSLVTVENSTGYMGFEELKTYAGRTAGLVDQARKSDMDFSMMFDLLTQEISILESMIQKKLDRISQSHQPPPSPADEGMPGSVAEMDQMVDGTGQAQDDGDLSTAQEDALQLSSPSKDQAPPKDRNKTAIASTLRVDHSKLDDLMNLIGELIINRNRFAMLSRSLEEGHDVGIIAQQLTETTNSMARISDDLQVTIMNVRMVPVQAVFSKFPRLVRDLSRKSNKKVQLVTDGEETELDKSVVELIGDPLVHLIRNSMDHGLESEDDRKKAGKNLTGTVWLRAAHRGNSVVIEVEDDGRGIDPEKMKAKAMEKNLITPEQAQNMDDQEAIDLIFAPGFSTAEKVTDISGRGVGMDVVKNNIKNLKGSVVVDSTLGKGSKFSITLPLTLAIIEALMIKVAGQIYAIPLDAVSETTKIESSKLSEINKRKAVTLRGEVLGLADLAELLELPVSQEERDVLPVVIVMAGDRRLGLVVDALLERQEVVIKSLGEYMGDQPGISGATIMGDGSVVLILDPHEVYKMAASK